MELRHLRYFAMTAEEENISRASARLHISQPAVSRQIKDLEEEMGVQLFERLRDGLKLTAAGNRALVHARHILRKAAELEEAMHPFRGQHTTLTLAVGYIPTALPAGLLRALRIFEKHHANIRVQIQEMTPGQQVQALRDDQLDLILPGMPWSSVTGEFAACVIQKVPMAVAVPADHPLARRPAIDLEHLQGESFVSLHEDQFPGRPELLARIFRRTSISPHIVAKARGLSELLGLVAAGRGVAFAPSDWEHFPHENVVFVELSCPRLTLDLSAVWKRERETPALLSFIQAITQPAAQDVAP